jgi:hypothetical protein
LKSVENEGVEIPAYQRLVGLQALLNPMSLGTVLIWFATET